MPRETSKSEAMRSSTNRMQAAGVRAMDAHASVTRAARRVIEEMDEVTSPHGVPVVELQDEDSMVIAVNEARDLLAKG